MIIDIKGSAEKYLRKMDKKAAQRIRTEIADTAKLKSTSEIPNDGKLRGYTDRYKIRVGNYRIIYKVEYTTHILITAIADRKDVYNKLFGITLSL